MSDTIDLEEIRRKEKEEKEVHKQYRKRLDNFNHDPEGRYLRAKFLYSRTESNVFKVTSIDKFIELMNKTVVAAGDKIFETGTGLNYVVNREDNSIYFYGDVSILGREETYETLGRTIEWFYFATSIQAIMEENSCAIINEIYVSDFNYPGTLERYEAEDVKQKDNDKITMASTIITAHNVETIFHQNKVKKIAENMMKSYTKEDIEELRNTRKRNIRVILPGEEDEE